MGKEGGRSCSLEEFQTKLFSEFRHDMLSSAVEVYLLFSFSFFLSGLSFSQ